MDDHKDPALINNLSFHTCVAKAFSSDVIVVLGTSLLQTNLVLMSHTHARIIRSLILLSAIMSDLTPLL